jgi:Tol biopolymer transport system component
VAGASGRLAAAATPHAHQGAGAGRRLVPDSRRLVFATKREGDELEQIYLLDVGAGGEARRLTNVSTGASNPRWRPDGQAILFESSVYAHAADDEANKKIIAERKARKYNVPVYEHFPVRYWN